ncbi:MAG: DUF4136 domain-containing protein [Tannerellaceae bacterium]|nr:DUF4136 domain-containing protein [Tannerellaceae bacterium]
MKPFILSALLLISFAGNAQSPASTVCRLGFTYDISRSPHWGNGKPVVTNVYPYSSAEEAGLKVNDIIETIEGTSVEELGAENIAEQLNPAEKNEVKLTVTNLADSAKPMTVKKDCKRTDAITESQLAVAFSMYSLESTSERSFVCPFKTSTDTVNFARYKSFAFAPIDENNRLLEETINACIEKELRKKGMAYNAANPDIVVETFYLYNKNPNYVKAPKNSLSQPLPVYRYDFALNQMQKYPFLPSGTAETMAEYILQLGIRFIDKQHKPGSVVWECEANEWMSAPFRLENYAQTHIPLMCMQYPYAKYSRNVQFFVSRKMYNYTGINYDINRLEQIVDVDFDSPAYIAGIRMRDRIEKIENQNLNRTAEEYTAAYKQFIMQTMSLRNPETLFTDANGFRFCMYWKEFHYTQVADALRNPKNMAVFAYLYKYAPYVNPSGVNTCTFHIRRGKERMAIVVRPTIHTETTVTIQ